MLLARNEIGFTSALKFMSRIRPVYCRSTYIRLQWKTHMRVCHNRSVSNPLFYRRLRGMFSDAAPRHAAKIFVPSRLHSQDFNPLQPRLVIVRRPRLNERPGWPEHVSARAFRYGISRAGSTCPRRESNPDVDMYIWGYQLCS